MESLTAPLGRSARRDANSSACPSRSSDAWAGCGLPPGRSGPAPRAGGAAARGMRVEPSCEQFVEHAHVDADPRPVACAERRPERRTPARRRERVQRRCCRRPQSGRARRPGARVRAEQPQQHRRRDQPADVEDRRAVPGRGAAAARHALLRPADALRRQRPRQQPHADRPPYRQARPPDTGRGSVQPVLHSRRPVRDRRGRAAAAPRLPRSEHDAPRAFAAGARVPRRRSHGLLRGRALRVRELRVRRPDDRDRPQLPSR